jgi:hypothetical protein
MDIYQRLLLLPGLRAGKSAAKERPAVRPVDEARALAIVPHVSAQVGAMIKVQLYTGMRSTEVCIMRPRDIDRSVTPWVYTPRFHKTQEHGIAREVPVVEATEEELRELKLCGYSLYPQDRFFLFELPEKVLTSWNWLLQSMSLGVALTMEAAFSLGLALRQRAGRPQPDPFVEERENWLAEHGIYCLREPIILFEYLPPEFVPTLWQFKHDMKEWFDDVWEIFRPDLEVAELLTFENPLRLRRDRGDFSLEGINKWMLRGERLHKHLNEFAHAIRSRYGRQREFPRTKSQEPQAVPAPMGQRWGMS